MTEASDRPGKRVAWTAVALAPIWLLLATGLLVPSFLDPMFDYPPGIAALPLGFIVLALTLLLTAAGVAVVRTTRSTVVRRLALSLLTVPAVLLYVFGPAIILIVQNLG